MTTPLRQSRTPLNLFPPALSPQDTLRHNVEGTRSLLQLALGCTNLRSVVHTSSAYVNLNFPHSSLVEEAIYPLMHGGMEADPEELVQVRN